MKKMMLMVGCLAALGGFADNNGTMAFLKQQAYAEMQRVQGQIDTLQTNHDDLEMRVGKLEKGDGEVANLRAEVASLKAELDALRRELAGQREGIVKDLSSRIAKIQSAEPPPPKAQPLGEHYEYTIKSGDSLFLIAQTFGTTVAKIKQMNNMKTDILRVGQKINIPKEK